MGLASLGDIPLLIDPDSVSWTFKVKVVDTKTLGGKVVQILGTDLGDMTVSGVFGNGDRSKGDDAGWEAEERFRLRLKTFTRDVASQKDPEPVRFVFPPRNWDFQVYVKRLDSEVRHSNAVFNPRWTMTLFVVEDNARTVVKGIRDLYIARLMDGIGWKQTQYNGPTPEEVADTISGYANAYEYVKAQFVAAEQGSTSNPQTPTSGSPG